MKSEDNLMSDFTHFNEQGRAKMVDVGEKPISQREWLWRQAVSWSMRKHFL